MRLEISVAVVARLDAASAWERDGEIKTSDDMAFSKLRPLRTLALSQSASAVDRGS